jgi:hypothetical protein
MSEVYAAQRGFANVSPTSSQTLGLPTPLAKGARIITHFRVIF